VAKKMRRVNPNHISAVALALSVLAGVVLYYSTTWAILLIFASIIIFVSAFFDALDGKVAKITKKANIRGDFLDHVADRYADLFILVGIIVSAHCGWLIGIFALTGVFMTSYLGTQAQAVGVKRDYGGMLGRADRLVLLIIVPLLQYALMRFFDMTVLLTVPILDIPLTPIEIMMLWFGFAGHFTALQRGIRTWRVLSKRI
jgi:archaetidylinositol phosphate synthase